MKYLILLIIVISISYSCTESHVELDDHIESYTVSDHQELLNNLQLELNDVLKRSKPKNLSMTQYSMELVNGNFSISDESIIEILEIMKPLEEYGNHVANKIKAQDVGLNDKYALAMFSPNSKFDESFLSGDFGTTDINPYLIQGNRKGGDDWLKCAAVAIGADALWALGGSSASSWSRGAMRKAFKAVAKRFLGSIGVAIAVVSFGVCMAQ